MKLWMKWMLQYIFRKIVVQGYADQNIQVVYGLMRNAIRAEFTEDNLASTTAYSRELHDSVWEA